MHALIFSKVDVLYTLREAVLRCMYALIFSKVDVLYTLREAVLRCMYALIFRKVDVSDYEHGLLCVNFPYKTTATIKILEQ